MSTSSSLQQQKDNLSQKLKNVQSQLASLQDQLRRIQAGKSEIEKIIDAIGTKWGQHFARIL